MVRNPNPRRRPTPTEVERRRDIVVRLWADRHSRDVICHAVDVGHGTIAEDLIARGVDRSIYRGAVRTAPLDPIAWRDTEIGVTSLDRRPTRPAPTPRPEPRPPVITHPWEMQDTTRRLRLFHESFVGDRLANQLAHAVFDARDAGTDTAIEWLDDLGDLLDRVAAEVHQLRWIVRDAAYRDLCMVSGRADVPAPGPIPIRDVSS